ncbi:MAG: hypothetical protein GC181_02350 [Bacteroidetes bacterium]|nr:hypothetical protein [Bacteroidota bacterium]
MLRSERTLAQVDTSTSNYDLTILTKFNPVLTSARKKMISPVLESADNTQPEFTYELPGFGYKVLPTYQPAKAVDLKVDENELLSGNYFKLGGGNYLTPYAEFQLHSISDKKYSYGAYGKHLSSNAGNPKNADFSDNELGIFGSKITKKGDLTGKLNFDRHVIHRYGYNTDSFEFAKKDINQIYNNFSGSVGYDNGTIRKKTAFKSLLDFYTFSNMVGRENDYRFKVDAQHDLRNKQYIDFNGYLDFTTYSRDTIQYNRMYIGIKPTYTLQVKKIDLTFGVNAVVFKDSSKIKPYIFPVVEASHFVVKDKVQAFAGIGGDVIKNTVRQLSYLNPFVRTEMQLLNTVTAFKAKVGLRGVAASRLDYLLRLDFSVNNNMPLFLTDSSATRPFNVVYDNVLVTGFHTGLGVRIDEKFKVQVAGTFYSYSTDKEAQAWQLPGFDVDFNLQYLLAKKLQMRLQVYAFGQRYQLDPENITQALKLNPFADINFMADYRYKKNISFFLNVNNISNARYQKWYNYPVYGLNVLAGVTFSL